jgi:hypothetical protein
VTDNVGFIPALKREAFSSILRKRVITCVSECARRRLRWRLATDRPEQIPTPLCRMFHAIFWIGSRTPSAKCSQTPFPQDLGNTPTPLVPLLTQVESEPTASGSCPEAPALRISRDQTVSRPQPVEAVGRPSEKPILRDTDRTPTPSLPLLGLWLRGGQRRKRSVEHSFSRTHRSRGGTLRITACGDCARCGHCGCVCKARHRSRKPRGVAPRRFTRGINDSL